MHICQVGCMSDIKVQGMMQLIKYILRIDYSLSCWFSSTKKTIIPGTAFLFLTKVAFFVAAIYFIGLPLLPSKLQGKISIILLCGLTAVIMYGLQSKIESAVRNLNFSKEYSKSSKTEKILHRLYGLAIFIGCFVLMFIIGVI